jgi:phospholipase C
MSAKKPEDHRMDHVVVLMFENHSFDNLLGYLYAPGEVPRFEGIGGRRFENRVPADAGAGAGEVVAVHPAKDLAMPYPDPGEEYPHINTQLFGRVDPPGNRFAPLEELQPPYNAPPAGTTPTMEGFVTDYVSAFYLEMGRLPTPEERAEVMAAYTPAQVPVLSGLAKGFAVFDHWFCDVPSQTFPNRSFFHAASSSGLVTNTHPRGKFAQRNDAPTIFERLEAHGRSWRVYFDPAQIVSATGLLHARRLAPCYPTHFLGLEEFYTDAREGTLPDYAFLEPNMFHPHTDMHPHAGARWASALGLRPPDTIGAGEELLLRVYDAIRTSAREEGSNGRNTLLLVTFDAHGGSFDHVPPPAAPAPEESPGELGFRFDRLGVRVPTILVSAWTDARAVVTEPFQATSMIRTLRDWWDFGPPLTRRDAAAPSFLPALARRDPRPPEEWPRLTARVTRGFEHVEQEFLRAVERLASPLEKLEADLVADVLAHEARLAGKESDTFEVEHGAAHGHLRRLGPGWFPRAHRD